MKFVLVIGLPGSGKTFYVRSLDGLVFDDILNKNLLLNLNAEKVIVVDHLFCIEKIRQKAVSFILDNYLNVDIEYIYFENNPQQCYKNIVFRNDKREISKYYVFNLSKRYLIPNNIKPLKVWEPNENNI